MESKHNTVCPRDPIVWRRWTPGTKRSAPRDPFVGRRWTPGTKRSAPKNPSSGDDGLQTPYTPPQRPLRLETMDSKHRTRHRGDPIVGRRWTPNAVHATAETPSSGDDGLQTPYAPPWRPLRRETTNSTPSLLAQCAHRALDAKNPFAQGRRGLRGTTLVSGGRMCTGHMSPSTRSLAVTGPPELA
jgi:hypothetical protein